MKATAALATALLLAGSALAAPSKLQQRRHERLAKKFEGRKHNRPLAVNATNLEETIVIEPNAHEVQYRAAMNGP